MKHKNKWYDKVSWIISDLGSLSLLIILYSKFQLNMDIIYASDIFRYWILFAGLVSIYAFIKRIYEVIKN